MSTLRINKKKTILVRRLNCKFCGIGLYGLRILFDNNNFENRIEALLAKLKDK
jgi:hypothetical protein